MVVPIVIRWGIRIPHLLNYAIMSTHSKVDKVVLVIPEKYGESLKHYIKTFYSWLLDRVTIFPIPFNVGFSYIKKQTADIPKPYIVAYPEIKYLEKILQKLFSEGVKKDDIVFNATEAFWLGTYVVARNFTSKGIGVLTISSFENVLSPPVKVMWRIVGKKIVDQISIAIAHTHTTKRFLLKLGLPEEKVNVIYPGIDTKMFMPKKCRKLEKDITFLFVGRLDAEKGIKELIKAWKRIDVHSNLRLVFVGDGRLRNLVVKLAQDRDNVRYLGFVPDKELPKIYHLGDIFLYLSKPKYLYGMKIWEEQFGFSVVEAMASGLTVVVTNTGALPEIVPSPPNYILNLRDLQPAHLAQKIVKIARSLNEHELCRNGVFNRVLVEEKYNVWKQSQKLASMLIH